MLHREGYSKIDGSIREYVGAVQTRVYRVSAGILAYSDEGFDHVAEAQTWGVGAKKPSVKPLPYDALDLSEGTRKRLANIGTGPPYRWNPDEPPDDEPPDDDDINPNTI